MGPVDKSFIEKHVTLPLGVVVERQAVDHPWVDHRWRPVAVVPGAGTVDSWRELLRGDGFVRYLVATLELELHRKETEAYKVNLSNHPPVVYVGLTKTPSGSAQEVEAYLVTASPYEAQDYLDSGDDIIEGVPMPDAVIAWVKDFVDRHHVDEPFRKRKRKRFDPDAPMFGRPQPGRRRYDG